MELSNMVLVGRRGLKMNSAQCGRLESLVFSTHFAQRQKLKSNIPFQHPEDRAMARPSVRFDAEELVRFPISN